MDIKYLLDVLDTIDECTYRDATIVEYIKKFTRILSEDLKYLGDHSGYAKENTHQDIINENITDDIDVSRIYQQYYLDSLIATLRDKIDLIADRLIV